jgi:D-3-phosphoglycerate dehydrogenase|tara:strand:- start:1334 stop:2347 length:1014 start_codon:yes stop_codon:yes gene_type:complete
MMRVFVTHNPEDLAAYYRCALPELRSLTERDGAPVDVVHNPLERDLTTPELIEAATGCDVIVAHRATPGEAELFVALPDLLAFLRCAVDISTIDVDAASASGVLVARADKSFVPSTAELALGLLLDCARTIAASTIDYRNGEQPPQRPGWQLAGQTAGILGYGAIGSYLAGLLAGIGMRVLVHDPFIKEVGDAAELVERDQLLAEADAVFPLAQATPETENMVDAAFLAQMKPGATLINVSRGELLDDDAVFAALESGQLGALGLDVGRAPDQRPAPLLAAHQRCVATPHLGGLTPQNADAQAMSSVEQISSIIAGEVPARSVNADTATRLHGHFKK